MTAFTTNQPWNSLKLFLLIPNFPLLYCGMFHLLHLFPSLSAFSATLRLHHTKITLKHSSSVITMPVYVLIHNHKLHILWDIERGFLCYFCIFCFSIATRNKDNMVNLYAPKKWVSATEADWIWWEYSTGTYISACEVPVTEFGKYK